MAQRSIVRASVAGLVVGVIAIGGTILVKAYKPYQARHDVKELFDGLNFYLSEQGSYPAGSTAEICGLLLGKATGEQNSRHLSYIDAKPRELNLAGEFVDPWGLPYRITTSPAPYVYSCGPNRADEHGAGDDISAGARP